MNVFRILDDVVLNFFVFYYIIYFVVVGLEYVSYVIYCLYGKVG